MAEICMKVLDGFGISAEWAVSIVAPIYSCYGAVKFIEHGMKVVKRVLGKRLRQIVSVHKMQFGFMPAKGTIDAVFILRRLHKEYHAKGKSCLCALWT